MGVRISDKSLFEYLKGLINHPNTVNPECKLLGNRIRAVYNKHPYSLVTPPSLVLLTVDITDSYIVLKFSSLVKTVLERQYLEYLNDLDRRNVEIDDIHHQWPFYSTVNDAQDNLGASEDPEENPVLAELTNR